MSTKMPWFKENFTYNYIIPLRIKKKEKERNAVQKRRQNQIW